MTLLTLFVKLKNILDRNDECTFGACQRFARAHTCHLAREAGSEESEPQCDGDLGKYYTWSKYVAF